MITFIAQKEFHHINDFEDAIENLICPSSVLAPAGQPKKVNIVMTRPDGKLVLAGTAVIELKNSKFSIRSISQLGMFPVLVEGSIRDSKLEITNAQFSTIIDNKKNQPIESDRI